MADENSTPAEESAACQSSGQDNSPTVPDEGDPEKGGGDGKSKALGSKGVGDYVKVDVSERVYE